MKSSGVALTGVALWVGSRPAEQKVTRSIPSQGTCLGCGFDHHSECVPETTDPCFSLPLMFLSLSSLPLSLKISKQIN